MGWGRMLLLGNVGQQLDISDLSNQLEALKRSIRSMRASAREGVGEAGQIASLREEIDELRLYVAVLVRLLSANDTIPRAQFERVLQALDASDGVADGKLARGPLGP